MNINISEQHLAVLKFKCEEFNANNRGGQAMSECDYASMILRDALAVHEADVSRKLAEFQLAEFRKLTKEKQEAALKAANEFQGGNQ